MELERKYSKGREEIVRHWTDSEVRDKHRSHGYDWRSNRTNLRVIAVTDSYRHNYDAIFRTK